MSNYLYSPKLKDFAPFFVVLNEIQNAARCCRVTGCDCWFLFFPSFLQRSDASDGNHGEPRHGWSEAVIRFAYDFLLLCRNWSLCHFASYFLVPTCLEGSCRHERWSIPGVRCEPRKANEAKSLAWDRAKKCVRRRSVHCKLIKLSMDFVTHRNQFEHRSNL